MSAVHEVQAEEFDEFCRGIEKLFDQMDDPAAPHALRITFPPTEFPIMPMHVESDKTMTSINGRVIDLAHVVMMAAKKRLLRDRHLGLEALKQYIVYPAKIAEGERFVFTLTAGGAARAAG